MHLFKSIIFIFLPFTIFSQTNTSLHDKVSDLLTEQNLTGAVWSVVANDDIIVDASGIKNTDTKEKMKSTNAILVGSITKSILALGILRLATEGKLNIDDEVKKYVPELTFHNSWQKSNPITIRHLLDHTSGISDLAIWHFFSTSSKPNTPLINAFQNNKRLLKVHTKAGTVFSYSNMGFTILGMIIESATDQKYENYLDDKLLTPLGMKNSSFSFISQIGEDANKNLAMGHFEDGSTVASASIYLRPAGQFTTTAYDMGLFLKFMMGDGSIKKKPFIDSIYMRNFGTPKNTIASENRLKNGYSFGVQKKDWYNRITLSHSGNIIGYKAYYYIFPTEKKAFFISYNIDHESADYSKINRLILDNLEMPIIDPSETYLPIEDTLRNWDGYYVPIFPRIVPFRLLDYISGYTKVSVSQNGATISPFQKKTRNLKYKGGNLFQSNTKIMASHLFYEDEQGSKIITTGTSSIIKINGLYILLVSESLIVGIIGIFYILIVGITQSIKFKKQFFRKPLAWSFTSIIILLIAILLIALQPFMKIGDLTAGSVLLAISSVLLPLFSIISLILLAKTKLYFKTFKFWSLICIIQLSILLFFNGMVPMTIWY